MKEGVYNPRHSDFNYGLEESILATRVRFSIPEREIENTGITFRRIVDSELHGDLTICQNHIVWRPKNNELIYRVSWEKFAEFAVEKGKNLRPKASAVKSKKKLKAVGA